MNGVLLDRISLDRNDLDFGALRASLDGWDMHDTTTPAQCAERIREAQVVVTNKVVLDRELLASAKQLKLVCIAATGTNNVDLAAARELSIPVCNVVHYATPSVVQHVFSLILSLTTRQPDYRSAVAEGKWAASPMFCLLDYPIREIEGLTLGIIGYGELGRAVARTAECFGLKVIIGQRPGGPERPGRIALPELHREADIISLHCPLTPETRGLIGPEELAQMKPDALLINTARGGIVDEAALADALRAGRLGGAGIDTLGVEPPVERNPLLQDNIPNLIVTPHIAWASRAARQRLIDSVADNIKAFRGGAPTNIVNQEG